MASSSSSTTANIDFAIEMSSSSSTTANVDFSIEMSSSSSCFDFALDYLDWLDKGGSFQPQEGYIFSLKMEVKLLKTFVVYARKWRSKHFYKGCILSSIKYLVCSIINDIHSGYLTSGADGVVMELYRHWDNIRFFATQIEDFYIILADDHYSMGDPDPQRLLDLIHSLLEILLDLHPYWWDTYEALCDQLEALKEKLMFLKKFISFVTIQHVEHMQLIDLLIHVQVVALSAARLVNICWFRSDEQTLNKMKFEISELLHKIMPADCLQVRETYIHVLARSKLTRSSDTFTKEKNSHMVVVDFIHSLLSNLLDLLELCASFALSIQNQMKKLHEGLKFLKILFGEWQEKFNALDNAVKDLVRVVICDAGIVIFSLSVNQMKEGLAKETDIALFHLLKVLDFIMAEVVQIYPPTSSSSFNFPSFSRINELGSLDFLLENLTELASSTANSIAFSKDQVLTVQQDLVFLRSFLLNIEEQRNQNEKYHTLWSRVMEVAYKAEFVIDSMLVGDKPDCSLLSLDTITEEIEVIKTEVFEICDSMRHDSQAQRITKAFVGIPSKVSTPTLTEVLVGLDEEVKSIIDGLTRGSKILDVVSIVGMPGLGKTTLANRVYNDRSIMCHFHIRAWRTVSQEYSKQRLLLQILGDNDLKMNEDDLAEKVYKHLKRKTYLIVLDDVWDIEAWNLLKASFPNDNNGSRILFTSRFHYLCSQFKSDCKPHHLRTLNDEESWELLQYKLFGKEACPPALSIIGLKIAKDCKGLPLTVVIVAGILSNIEQDCWEEVANNLNSSTVIETENCMQTLDLSYKYLPDYLKQCLLYFGAFQEDQEIPVRKLKLLWISEGFVQKIEVKSLEDIAEDYLMELIARSLVMVSQQRSVGGVKTCRIHDLLHEFCVAKAKGENFLHKFDGYNKFVSFTGLYSPHRLCIYSSTEEESEKPRPYFPHLRTLLFFGNSVGKFGFRIFKLLTVLDLGGHDFGRNFPMDVELLVHLRYLAIYCESSYIPESIAKLSKLETFIIKVGDENVLLPHTIWNMQKLRHLGMQSFRTVVGFLFPVDNLDVSPDLYNLGTCKLVIDPFSQSSQQILTKLPSIRKLECVVGTSIESGRSCNIIKMDFLSRLESLKVSNFWEFEFAFPMNLKKLTLSLYDEPWDKISAIGGLPNLEVLKLLDHAFVGNTWEMKEGEFPKLRFLKLEDLDIVKWTASCDNFPPLQKLILHRCENLEEVPSDLGDISTIEMIEVRRCHKSAVSSVKQIQEQQMDMGNECLKLVVEENYWDRAFS